jgi:hypothetical protein
MTDQPKAADSTLHPNWKSLADCPKCGEFMGHGHECQPAADIGKASQLCTIERNLEMKLLSE